MTRCSCRPTRPSANSTASPSGEDSCLFICTNIFFSYIFLTTHLFNFFFSFFRYKHGNETPSHEVPLKKTIYILNISGINSHWEVLETTRPIGIVHVQDRNLTVARGLNNSSNCRHDLTVSLYLPKRLHSNPPKAGIGAVILIKFKIILKNLVLYFMVMLK